MKIYTKKGDTGKTSLVGGKLVEKSEFRIDCYGELDELNSFIGLGVSQLNILKSDSEYDETKKLLSQIQSHLFDLGSNLACEPSDRQRFNLPQIPISIVNSLEESIDHMDASLPQLKHFILPGGCLAAAQFHVCRAVCRRVERKMVKLSNDYNEQLPINSLILINRLSDYFFVLARFVNIKAGQGETKWVATS